MKKEWADAVISKISVAVYVPPDTGKQIHKDRPVHGFVLNDEYAVQDYCFDNGYVMHTYEKSLFYLPRGASYHVKNVKSGGCYAINFETDIMDGPFCVNLKNSEELFKYVKRACLEWKRQAPSAHSSAMSALYHTIYQLQKEAAAEYVSKENKDVIAPAFETIEKNFYRNDLSVAYLAMLCGVSEVYFRKIFMRCFGISPKEYIIQKRMEYAKQILRSGHFEISEVANLCGYREPCHFSREFKKRVGVSPKGFV